MSHLPSKKGPYDVKLVYEKIIQSLKFGNTVKIQTDDFPETVFVISVSDSGDMISVEMLFDHLSSSTLISINNTNEDGKFRQNRVIGESQLSVKIYVNYFEQICILENENGELNRLKRLNYYKSSLVFVDEFVPILANYISTIFIKNNFQSNTDKQSLE